MAIMPGLRIVQANAIWAGVALWRLAILSSVWLHDRRPSPTGLYAMTGMLCREHQGSRSYSTPRLSRLYSTWSVEHSRPCGNEMICSMSATSRLLMPHIPIFPSLRSSASARTVSAKGCMPIQCSRYRSMRYTPRRLRLRSHARFVPV